MSILTSTSSIVPVTSGRWRRAIRVATVSLVSGVATIGLSLFPAALGSLAHAQEGCVLHNHNVIVNSGTLDVLASQNKCIATNKARLIFQSDGNLVVYNEFQRPVFASNTVGRGFRLIFQNDGNLVIYSRFGTSPSNAVFSTRTQGNPGDFLAVQTDGNVVIYSKTGRVLFATNTRH